MGEGVEQHQPRAVCALLAGYLCGTHSGALTRSARRRTLSRFGPEAHRPDGLGRIVQRVLTRSLSAPGAAALPPWDAYDFPTARLMDDLKHRLVHEDVVELIVFGSAARGNRTGFSDLDAILVIRDRGASSSSRLKALRAHILAAQRSVLLFQPMQHHSFLVVPESLMGCLDTATGLPQEALTETRGLFGAPIGCGYDGIEEEETRRSLADLARSSATETWPSHPHDLHKLLASFQLLPAVYLHSQGTPVSKADSFAAVGGRFPEEAWALDVLHDIRALWPHRSYPSLNILLRATSNPWDAVVLWRRYPRRPPIEVRPLLSEELLVSLNRLAQRML